ncbi:MAG: prepilin-type N-terminal cleavage/methylation domain-containing protein [Kiritimatiellae bacterium]|nr:prepilin-type N-terminal cleavage/methylation domain-containing protein [Kiritimatiellia bacterium]
MKQPTDKSGFTLIELIIVVAIIAFIATVAIGKFKDMREAAAKKIHFASIANVQRTIETAIAHSDSIIGMFNYCDALVTMKSETEPATGAPGTYAWAKDNQYWRYEGAKGGVYAGQTVPMPVYDAGGNGAGITPSYESVQEANTGISDSLLKMLGIRYLTDSEAKALYNAGIGIIAYHNPSSAQAYGAANRHPWYQNASGYSGDNLAIRGGGPGFRPDASAFYPVYVSPDMTTTNRGLGVAVLDPGQAGAIYRAFVSSKSYPTDKDTLDALKAGTPEDWFAWGLPRLVVIGLGKNSDTVNRWFEVFPRDNTLDKTKYWNYCLVFQMNNGGRAGSDAKFVGVIDSRGNTVVGAEGNMDWN